MEAISQVVPPILQELSKVLSSKLDPILWKVFIISDTKFSLGEYFMKLLFYKGLVMSFSEYGFRRENIGTIFWNNGTRSLIKNQSFQNQSEKQLSWWEITYDFVSLDLDTENRIVHSGIAYMP